MSLLDHLAKIHKIKGPFMVIAPLCTIDHWKQVFEQWTYFNVVTYHDMGGARGRATLRHNEWYFTDVTRTGLLTKKA